MTAHQIDRKKPKIHKTHPGYFDAAKVYVAQNHKSNTVYRAIYATQYFLICPKETIAEKQMVAGSTKYRPALPIRNSQAAEFSFVCP